MGIQWLCLLNMFMGVVVAFIFFGRRTRKLGEQHNARTFPQLLGMHYKSRSIQIFIATIIFIGMPLYAAVVMKGGAVFIEQMFHIGIAVHPWCPNSLKRSGTSGAISVSFWFASMKPMSMTL